MDMKKINFAELEARVLADEYTKGELQLIQSPKHPGDIFVKVKGTKNTFVCKFYGYDGDSKISPAQAIINAHYFLECWNNYSKLLAAHGKAKKEIKNLKIELEKMYH